MTNSILDGLKLADPVLFKDERGYFFESYNRDKWFKYGISDIFFQDNESCSCKGTMRGLHYQLEPKAQSKLVRVVRGAVIDFVLDIRKSSDSFGEMFFVYLSGENHRQFYIPHGFAHGFIALEDDTVFAYKCDNFYSREHERGISMFDKDLDVFGKLGEFSRQELGQKLEISDIVISEKDKHHPDFKEAEYFI